MFEIYWIYYILGIVMIPGILLGSWAQARVKSTFDHYNKIETKHGLRASEVARNMLDAGGCAYTKVGKTKGELTDNYNPKSDTVSLSESVYDQTSIGAVGVAAHEIGHVFQHKGGYSPIKVRKFLVPVMRISGAFVWPLLILGILFEMTYYVTTANVLIIIAICIYGLNIVFSLITLPIELNASKRAEKMLLVSGEMDEEEVKGVKKVLNAAAWTYVASLVMSILSLLRVILLLMMTTRQKR